MPKTEAQKQQEAFAEIDYRDLSQDADLVCPTCKTSKHCYIQDHNQRAYCIDCGTEFTVAKNGEITVFNEYDDDDYNKDYLSAEFGGANKAAEEQIKSSKRGSRRSQAQKLIEVSSPSSYKGYGGYNGGYGSYTPKNCFHRPQHVIAGKGWGIWAGKRADVKYSLHQFDLVLNLTYSTAKERHSIPVQSLSHWENYGSGFTEIQLDWADMGVVNLPREFWTELLDHIVKNKLKVLVFCEGGHGRTGTAVGVLMCLALDYTPEQAVAWIRKNYCEEAIETSLQREYIVKMAKAPKAEPKRKAASTEAE